MPSNNSKYTDEMRERTVLHILSSGKSATPVAEELGIDVNRIWTIGLSPTITRRSKTIQERDANRPI